MITEDYVSFETAKLLKEKGFDESIETLITQEGKIYHLDENSISNKRHGTICNSQINAYSNDVSCPTLQMAMKWLREIHKIFIQIALYSKLDDYCFEVFQNTHRLIVEKDDVYNSYEAACEAAIKYCLKLI